MPTNTSSTDKPHTSTANQHPEEWQQDLNPHAMAGQNLGAAGPQMASPAPTAYEVKTEHRQLSDFRMKNSSVFAFCPLEHDWNKERHTLT